MLPYHTVTVSDIITNFGSHLLFHWFIITSASAVCAAIRPVCLTRHDGGLWLMWSAMVLVLPCVVFSMYISSCIRGMPAAGMVVSHPCYG